ncbi:MAG: hypothetical protein EA365_03640 [Gloeocapsa sp. DLM2.Bin57]|nr:MAG: hypothetical protein EA365_03640 [Gloeocapsa sp. DLM2.Bin57]
MNNILNQASQGVTKNLSSKPTPDKVVEALLLAEKNNRQKQQSYQYQQLIGKWRLCFITGTQKTRQKAGVILGAGKYIPPFVKIYLTYSEANIGVNNTVNLAGINLTLTGPVKFLSPKNILAFDFTRINLGLFNKNIYQSYLGKGQEKEMKFQQERVAKQAFFSYFLITEEILAARGREGGLALWGKE